MAPNIYVNTVTHHKHKHVCIMQLLFLFVLALPLFVNTSLATAFSPEHKISIKNNVAPAHLFYWGIGVAKNNISFTGDEGLKQLQLHSIEYNVIETPTAVQKERSVGYSGYMSHSQIVSLFRQLANDNPKVATIFKIGKSVQGRDLIGLRIVKNKNTPQTRYIGNMHGNEIVGREMIIELAKYLLEEYNRNNRRIVRLIENTDIWLLPTMNPDGYALRRRTNANGVDLNRNFPDRFFGNPRTIQPEVRAVMDWSKREHFILSANLHGGDLVANYGYDGNRQHRSGVYTATPDDELMKDVAKVYSFAHEKMHNSREFPSGITNGAKWYVLYGGLQDWNYEKTSDIGLTMELSFNKTPSSKMLPTYWQDNREAMIQYLERVHGASVWGKCRPNIPIHVREINHIVKCNKNGFYWRLLPTSTTSTKQYHIHGHVVHVDNKPVRLDL